MYLSFAGKIVSISLSSIPAFSNAFGFDIDHGSTQLSPVIRILNTAPDGFENLALRHTSDRLVLMSWRLWQGFEVVVILSSLTKIYKCF